MTFLFPPAKHVLGRHEPILERRRHAPLQEHRPMRLAGPLQKTEVLHVASADLNDVGDFFDGFRVCGVHQFGHDPRPGFARTFSQRLRARRTPCPWKL